MAATDKQIIKGSDLMLFINGKSIAYATAHTLSLSSDTSDISSKDHGIWGASEVNKVNWEITSENLFTVEEFNSLFDHMITNMDQTIDVVFGLKSEGKLTPLGAFDRNIAVYGNKDLENWTNDNTFGYHGDAHITSFTSNANNGENATFSITLTGVGPIKKLTA